MVWLDFGSHGELRQLHIDNMYVHCRKTSNVFLLALIEKGRKAKLLVSLLSCFAANANELYIFRQCRYIVFILQRQKTQNNCLIF